MTIYNELRALLDQFHKEKIEYAICGGMALAAHGWPRTTMDIDILIEKEKWNKRIKLESKDGPLTVVSKDGLVAMKKLRGSGQDKDDLRVLRYGNKK